MLSLVLDLWSSPASFFLDVHSIIYWEEKGGKGFMIYFKLCCFFFFFSLFSFLSYVKCFFLLREGGGEIMEERKLARWDLEIYQHFFWQ